MPKANTLKHRLAAVLLSSGLSLWALMPAPALAGASEVKDLTALLQSPSLAPEVKAAMTTNMDQTALDLLAVADPNAQFADGRSLLFMAAYFGNERLFQLLLAKGADPNRRDRSGTTVLMGAASGGNARIVHSLIAGGAQINARAKDGWCALLAAAAAGQDEVMTMLLKQGAEPWSRDIDGGGLLHHAAASGRLSTLKLALAQGQDIDAARNDGWTPLTLAAFEGHTPIVSELLSRHADVNARDSFGLTALYWALTNKHVSVVNLLLDQGASANDTHSEEGTTLLHLAAQIDAPELIERLLERGANPNQRDTLNHTPLIKAIHAGLPRNVERMLAGGGDVKQLNRIGQTLIKTARSIKQTAPNPADYDRIIELLKAAGAQE